MKRWRPVSQDGNGTTPQRNARDDGRRAGNRGTRRGRMPHRAGGARLGRAGAGRAPTAQRGRRVGRPTAARDSERPPPFPPAGDGRGRNPPTGGLRGDFYTCRSAATTACLPALAQAEPPPMNMGGEAEHRGPDARGTLPRRPGQRTAEPAGRMTPYPAAGGLPERVWPGRQPAWAPWCRRAAVSRSPPGLAPQGRPDDEPQDSPQRLCGDARACRRRSLRPSWSAGGQTGRRPSAAWRADQTGRE